MGLLDSLMILVCAVALVILIALAIYTWVRWHRKQIAASFEAAPTGIEVTGVTPAANYQRGYLNDVGRDSPNLSGSRTFLHDDVLKQKAFPRDAKSPAQFESKDSVYHADAERNPKEMMAGDVVFHANRPSIPGNNETVAADKVDVGHVAYNVDETSGKRRWPESMARTSDSSEPEVSHRKNTYL